MEKYTAARAEYDILKAEYNKTNAGKKPVLPKKPKEPQVPNTTHTTKEEYFTGTWRTHQMSDHLPLWVELK